MREEERLNLILDRVMDAQKFAEAKNITLITFNIAVITILSQTIKNIDFINVLTIFISSFLFGSLLISIISFIPIIHLKGHKDNNPNVIFFGSIAKYSVAEYSTIIKDKFKQELICEDLIKQIVINSKITQRKMNYFKLSIRLLFFPAMIFYVIEAIKNKK